MMTKPSTVRLAGLLYLLLGLGSGFAMMMVDSKLYIPGDAAATLQAILTHGGLFRIGFLCNIAGQIAFLYLAHQLYKIFKPFHPNQARLLVLLVLASIPIACLTLIFQYAGVSLAQGSPALAAIAPATRQALAMLFLDLHRHGYLIAQFFWGLWLLPMGWMSCKTKLAPKLLSLLLMIGCFGYLFDSALAFSAPQWRHLASPGIAVAGVAEIGMVFWLLLRAGKGMLTQGTVAEGAPATTGPAGR